MNVKKKRTILQVVNGLAIGGGELKLLELIRNLNPEKYRIVIISVGQGGPLEEEFRRLGYPLIILEKKFAFDLSLIFKLAKLIKQFRADIVMTTLFYADVLGAYASWLSKIKHVISWEVVTSQYKKRHLYAYRAASKKMTHVVAVSDAIAKKLILERKIPSSKVMTIHYGIDLKKYHFSNKVGEKGKLGIDENEMVIATVARLTDQKGHRYLIEAAPKIIRNHPNVRFVFIGDGYLKQKLKTLTDRLKIAEHFLFLGMRNDIIELLNLSDIFVLPSLYEGFPNVVLEAMACAKPVIATAVDGTPEAVVDSVTGYLVPPRNPEALSKAIIRLLDNPQNIRLYGMKGRKRVEKHFSLENQIRQFESLFEDKGQD